MYYPGRMGVGAFFRRLSSMYEYYVSSILGLEFRTLFFFFGTDLKSPFRKKERGFSIPSITAECWWLAPTLKSGCHLNDFAQYASMCRRTKGSAKIRIARGDVPRSNFSLAYAGFWYEDCRSGPSSLYSSCNASAQYAPGPLPFGF